MNLITSAKFAFRQLWKNRTVSVLNLIGLAFSIACCVVIGMYVINQLSFDEFHKNGNRIYRVTETQKQPGGIFQAAVTPGPLAPALIKDFPEISRAVRIGSWSGTLKYGKTVIDEKQMLLTEPSFFSMFTFSALMGNVDDFLKSDQDMVITEDAAVRLFGSDWKNSNDIIGETVTFNGEQDFRVAGVVANPPANSSINFSVLLPLSYLFKTDEWSNNWGSNNYHTYIEVKPGSDMPAFEVKARDQLKKYVTNTEDKLGFQPLSRQYLYSKFDFNTDWGIRSNIKYVQIFSAVGLILLIIACVNFVNLSTAGAIRRSLEVGVRKVNGASRRQLVFQFLGETILLSSLAGLLAIILISLTRPYFLDFTGIDLEIDFTQPVFIGLLVGFVLVIGVLAGAYPAFVLSSFKPLNILKSGQPLSGAKFVFRSLVVVQFAVSITLIVAAIFMYRQLNLIRSKDLGFDKANLVNVRLNGKLRDNIEVIKQDLEKLPAISAASPATMTLVNVNNTSNFKWDGMPADKEFLITQANIDPGFLQTLGIQLISGHNFSFQKTNDTANFILNQTAVRRMGYNDQTILGMGIDFWGAKGRVIGVVRDFNFKPLSAAVEPFVFRYQPMDGYFTLFVRLKPGNPSKALADLTTTLRKYESELPPEYVFVDESLDRLYENDKHTANMILLFSCLTILVGCLGLFGLSVIISQQRIREIGIRKVLGAGFASLAALLTTSYLRLVLIAGIVAIPAACVAVNYWLRDFAYKTTIDAATLAFVLVSVMAIACMVMLLQVVRVMRTNPALVMRRK